MRRTLPQYDSRTPRMSLEKVTGAHAPLAFQLDIPEEHGAAARADENAAPIRPQDGARRAGILAVPDARKDLELPRAFGG